MKKLTIALIALLAIAGNKTKAQSAFLDPNPWTIGIGADVVENNGFRYHQMFNLSNSWNIVPYPSRFLVAHTLGYGFSVEATFDYSQELGGKSVDQERNTTTEDYSMYDLNFIYNLHALFNSSKSIIQPYILWGGGFNYLFPFEPREGNPKEPTFYHDDIGPPFIFRNFHGFGSMNVGLGFVLSFHNIAPTSNFFKRISLEFQTMGNFTDDANDFITNSITILYKLPHKLNKPQLI